MGEQLSNTQVSNSGCRGHLFSSPSSALWSPTGICLGSFIILYINDVATQVSPGSSISLFADDMALYCPICSTVNFSVVQYGISSISLWIRNNFYPCVQPAKCHAMVLTHKRPPETFSSLYIC